MRLTVYDYFSRAMQQPAGVLSGCLGESAQAPDGASVVFCVDGVAGRLAVVSYKCTCCVTLVALCEHLSDLIRVRTPDEAIKLKAEDLLALHREIPAERQDRASLAVEAMHSAVNRLIEMESS